MTYKNVFTFLLCLCVLALSMHCTKKRPERANLSPAVWQEGDLARYTKLNQTFNQPHPLAVGKKGMVAGTSGALAVKAGLEALKQGGSAVDAALTTSLAQISLSTGCWVSYAGFMTMVSFDAETGGVYAMNAAYNTVQAEDDPLSIPSRETPSGRATPVPGFMAGVQAAHDRFGRLPFARLFDPAIYFAEVGFEVDKRLAALIKAREETLFRRPGTKKIFTGNNGDLLKEGDLIRQPQLTETLKRVAAQGADYMYRGEWAEQFVNTLQNEGGKMSMKDLEEYEVIWTDPVHTSYKGYDVYAAGLPGFGGVNIVEALNLLDASSLSLDKSYTSSAETLYWLIQISRVAFILGPAMAGIEADYELLDRYFPQTKFSLQSRTRKEYAQFVWKCMQTEKWKAFATEAFSMMKTRLSHSDSVVAVDEQGNMAAVVHTINGGLWGRLGLRVGGISIPDSACFQQDLISKVGPGVRLPDPTNPLIIMKGKLPVLASGSIGVGLHEATFLGLVNILDYGLNPKDAVEAPFFMCPEWMPTLPTGQMITFGNFNETIIDEVRSMGQELRQLPKENQSGFMGIWICLTANPETGVYLGCVPPYILNGLAEGY